MHLQKGEENTPPPLPSLPVGDDVLEEMYEDDVAEEIDVGEGQTEVSELDSEGVC